MAQLGNLLVTGVSRLLSKLYVNDSVTAPTFIGKLQGNADTATKATSADSATTVVDYGDTSKNIKIGYSGSGITGDNIKFIAGYTGGDGGSNVGKIKDVSKDALKSWLGLGSLAYSSATIPSVGNGTVTVKQNGTSKGTFTMNQSGNTTIELTDNNTVYTHPSYTAKSSGLYKVAVDATGHVSAATAVTKADITGLGIPASDTNTWRGIQNNLTSTSTTDSLSAAQGKVLNDKFASYVPTSRTVNGKALSANISLNASDVGASASGHTHNYVKDAGNNSSNTTFAYSKAGMEYGDYEWVAGWNGYELRAVNKNQFATSGHTHTAINNGVTICGRTQNSGDDEGLVINKCSNNYAGLILGSPDGVRSVFYLTSDNNALWRYNNGSSSFDINHPKKAGTVALTSDIPSKLPASDVYAWAKASTKPSYSWGEISGKPSTYTPSSHNHDDRYYTETEINNKLGDLSSLSSYGSDVASILKAIIAKIPATYSGSYEVTPSASAQSLSTSGKVMEKNVSVSAIPYKEESNSSGTTVTIG